MNRRHFIVTAGATLASLTVLPKTSAFSQASQASAYADSLLLLGTDYYPDQTPESLWEEDAKAMAAFGITNVRIAEFAWARMEPKEGSFDFAWLQRAVKILHANHIAVILGTPSAAPPPWLTQKYPEVMMVDEHGMTLNTGSRRFTCPTNKTYRRLSLTIATEMARTFAGTPGVVGWQIDNEYTLGSSGRCYCRYCREGFQQWLRSRYGSLEAMNAAWGTVFWSNTYTDFSQVPVPLPSGAPPNPGLVLDYDRYQSYANVSTMEEQLAVLRKLCPKHFVTTNNVTLVDTINQRDLYRNLDFVASDNYPGFFSVVINGDSGNELPPDLMAPMIAFTLDASRSMKDGKPFMIMEQQSGKAGQPYFSPQPEPGQLRLWTYQAVAHGAMGINYFRWDTENFGPEQYWHGILRHDRTPSPGFAEMKRTIAELKSLGSEALNASYAAESALCFDYSSDWALAVQPSHPKLKYNGEVLSWYGSMNASHAGVDIVDCFQDLAGYKVVAAPAMYVVTPKQAEQIRKFVQGGGTFIAGFRLGVKDEHSAIVNTPLPGLLRDVMGAELADYQPVYGAKQGVKFSGMLSGPDAECHIWADVLDPKGAEVLATYTAGMHSGKPAITVNHFGKGKAIYLGAHLEPADLGRVLLTLMAASGVKSAMQAPPSVEVTTRRSKAGSLTYLLNHAASVQAVQLGGNYKDALTGAVYAGSVELEPYAVRVLRLA